MKKYFLLAVAAVGLTISVSALSESAPLRLTSQDAEVKTSEQIFKGTRADDSNELVYGYCQELSSNIGVNTAGVKIGAAIEIPADVAQRWKGNFISGVRIGYGATTNKSATIFVTTDLNKDPIYSEDVTLNPEEWNDAKFSTPVEIPEGKFFVGYMTTLKVATDYPIGIDNFKTSNTLGGYIGYSNSAAGSVNWGNYASQYGSVCVKAILTGNTLPVNDVAISAAQLSSYVSVNSPFTLSASLTNNGVNNVESLTAACEINGKVAENVTVKLSKEPLAPGESCMVTFSGLICDSTGENIPLNLTVNTVNGEEDTYSADNSISSTFNCIEKAYERAMVVEEWTGNWCGWCVYGIVAMQYMQETYGNDRFIGIAVHGGSYAEPMRTSSYDPFMSKVSGYPGCIINRKTETTPFKEVLEEYYVSMQNESTFVGVDITDIDVSNLKDDYINVTADVNFSLAQSNIQYRLAFVITEDHVGPYNQSNYYAGGANGPMGGWESKGSSVSTYYNEVARYIETCLGIANSLPGDIEENATYSYTAKIPTSNITNIENCTVIALLLNYKTGEVINATKMRIPAGAAVGEIPGEEAVSIKAVSNGIEISGDYTLCSVYAIDGKAVAAERGKKVISLPEGLYIVRVTTPGNKEITKKIIIK